MFEDIIGTKNKNEKHHITRQCPHCETKAIVKRTTNVYYMDNKRKRPAYCPKCRKYWYIVYDYSEDKHSIQTMGKN